jgi:hypothetical protein
MIMGKNKPIKVQMVLQIWFLWISIYGFLIKLHKEMIATGLEKLKNHHKQRVKLIPDVLYSPWMS